MGETRDRKHNVELSRAFSAFLSRMCAGNVEPQTRTLKLRHVPCSHLLLKHPALGTDLRRCEAGQRRNEYTQVPKYHAVGENKALTLFALGGAGPPPPARTPCARRQRTRSIDQSINQSTNQSIRQSNQIERNQIKSNQIKNKRHEIK